VLITLPNAYGDATTNMALDSALLQTVPEKTVIFRHYGWVEPTITFGYSQKRNEVEKLIGSNITLCRRATGGGIVDHRDDWTYTLILHHNTSAAQYTSTLLYQRIHKAITQALSIQKVITKLAPCLRNCKDTPKPRQHSTSQCFLAPVTNDVLLTNGKKIAGAAMKRSRSGLLIQGSIDRTNLPLNFDLEHFTKSLEHSLAKGISIPLGTFKDIRTLFDHKIIAEQRKIFESAGWQNRR